MRGHRPMNVSALPRLLVEPIVRRALEEDLGRSGDVTTEAVVPNDAVTTALMNAREPGVVAGLDCAAIAFELVDAALDVAVLVEDGARVSTGDGLLKAQGSAQAVLTAERVALNFVGRLSGVATLTRAYVDAVAHTQAKIADTRKTTPGLRALEKRAVRLGGGSNHRFGLDDALLIKDNHIAAGGGVTAVLKRARDWAGHMLTIEIEVDTLEQLDEALAADVAQNILLDNMTLDQMRQAVALTAGRATLEASGGVSLETVAAIAETGVDYISSGALTHSAKTLDIGLDF
ncbi:MAG: carboxylating nicotinate-nucleotide diphosphorylase [Pseudomonadota bacterium]